MELLFLGTGGGEMVPSAFCKCKICEEARRKRKFRIGSSLLINRRYLIDLPPNLGLAVALNGIDLSSVTHLFITHSHQDHFDPSQLTASGRSQLPPLKIYCNEYLKGLLPYYKKFNRFFNLEKLRLEIHILRPFQEVIEDEGRIRVIPIVADHDRTGGEIPLNFIIEIENRTLLYGCDTGWYPEESWIEIRKYQFDVVILDCTFHILKESRKGHLSIKSFLEMKATFEKERLLKKDSYFIAQHIGHYPFQDGLEKRLSKERVILAYDAMRVSL